MADDFGLSPDLMRSLLGLQVINSMGQNLAQIGALRSGRPYQGGAQQGIFDPSSFFKMQLLSEEAKRKDAEEKRRRSSLAEVFGQYHPAAGGTPWKDPDTGAVNYGQGLVDRFGPDTAQTLRMFGAVDPKLAMSAVAEQMKPRNPIIQEFFDQQGRPYKAQFDPATNSWRQIGGAKTDVLSPAAVAQKSAIAAAGKPDISQKSEFKMAESLAKPIGEMLDVSKTNALAAIDTLNTTDRIRAALESGNINLGPGATLKTIGDRLALVTGLGGATTAERLANTTSTVKGLAQLTLDGRKQLKGQGQVSDYEGRILERAASGDIDSLTAPELRVVLDVADRLARIQHSRHGALLDEVREMPDFKNLAPFYKTPDLHGRLTPPNGAVEMLRSNPDLAPQFDQKYGAGSSQRYLGGR